MKSGNTIIVLCLAGILALLTTGALADDVMSIDDSSLDAAFQGAQKVNLATSKVPSVVKLREVVKIPPPTSPVLVKTFKKESLPDVLHPAFANPGIMGVTIRGRYVAILHTEFPKEYEDVLSHELVHAYITQVSPKPLPFWFQEGSAVHFSTDKGWKFYGKPSDKQVGVLEGRVMNLTDTYKQKLQSFHFMIDQEGEKKFDKWYRDAVMTGTVEPRTLLGLPPKAVTAASAPRASFKPWLGALVGVVVMVVMVAGYFAVKRDGDF